MAFNLQVQDQRPQLIMQGIQALGQGLSQAGDAVAARLEKNKEDAKTMAIGQKVLEGEGYDPAWLKLQSAETIAGLTQGVQVKAGLEHVRNQLALQRQQLAGQSAFAQAIGAYNNPMGPFQASGPTPEDRMSAGLQAAGPNIDERGVQAMVNLFQHATNARQNVSMSGLAKSLGGDLGPGEAGPAMSPSMAFLNALRANPEAINNPQFSHVAAAIDRIAEMGDAAKAGTLSALPDTGYAFVNTGKGSGTPIPLPKGAAGAMGWAPMPDYVSEKGGVFRDDTGKVHVVPPRSVGQFGNLTSLEGQGAASELTHLQDQINAVDHEIAAHGEAYKPSKLSWLGLGGTLKETRDDLMKKYQARLKEAQQTGQKLPTGFTPMPPPSAAKTNSAGKFVFDPATGQWE